MIKEKVFSVFLIILTAACIIWGVDQLKNSSSVHAARQDDKFSELENFSQVYDIIKKRYVDDVTDAKIVEGAIKGMLVELDPHSSYYNAEQYKSFQVDMDGEFGGLGMTVGMKDGVVTIIAPIEDTPAYKAGIKAGDIIYKIDNTSAAGMNTDEAVKLMRGKAGTKIKLTILRAGEEKPLEFNLVRDIIKVKSVKYRMIDNIGYIRLTGFQKNSADEVKSALQSLNKENARAFILDLRYNPGGSLDEAVQIVSLFVPAGQVVVTTKGRTDDNSLKTRALSFREVNKPIVVLVDEGSASASEIVAGALQDYGRAVIVGTNTFGKASVQTVYELRNGAAMKLTTARYYTPNGRSIQGVGIVPDVVVPRGKVVYSDISSFAIKERDLAGHLVGENETVENADNETNEDTSSDIQLQSALQILKGLILYGNK